ncbi:hypothetical protein NM688_g8366 [Phlebia brevispora]|uniref:Uncharacterized protein n=1 Tax=Phlebia brevispora TaxID=194682 RepID=A0ACC1RUA4_9APHY|nr:hypothetical protein NM688_g8366 [Phlebia brevispora]
MATKCGGSSSSRKTLKDCVRHFTPAWFAVIMGTGAISILFHNYPYADNSTPMKMFTYIFFFLNLALLVVFNVLTLARYIIFPDIWGIMIRHPVQSLYIGCYPMGAATLINIGVGLIYEEYSFGGRGFLYFLWACWWVDVILSFICAFALPLYRNRKTIQDHALSRMTAIWLLPVVTLIVASSSGGVLAPALLPLSEYHALLTLTLSAFMVAVGLALAFMILTMYLLRLIVYGVPQGASVISVFIPLGPMGQGGYSILLLGQGFRTILPLKNNSQVLTDAATGETINVICVCVAFVLWALGTMWLLYAILAVQEVLRSTRFPFKLPFWGLIFPNGVYANLTIQLYRDLDINSLRVWGAIYSGVTLCLWIIVFIRTLTMLRSGAIFESPCIEEIDMARGMEKHTEEAKGKDNAQVFYQNGSGDGSATGALVTSQSM